ncbi:putative plant disease resistance response protein [Rosa chinensis]|uniref:Dirigent protein n=1 Tax=Rosa chinensis TaxID=74649 RepID=A0A2P6QN20_ROSCH|nr:dirigent protein 22 [Rosa chinensis]PRQ35570.1 putative plant disease resistance response protein [Rosa chinensis]
MARILPTLAFHLLIISSLLSSFSMILVSAEDHEFVQSMDPELFGLKKEKLTHFRMYWHDVVDGPIPSAVTIVQPPSNSSQTRFGLIRMFDNALTQGPEPSSKLLGRAQGFYGSASQEDISLLMAQNFAFVQGKYNGSTVTLMGRNSILNKVRELSVIGGSGLFRYARGYALATTQSFNASKSDDAIVEYNIYVLHY